MQLIDAVCLCFGIYVACFNIKSYALIDLRRSICTVHTPTHDLRIRLRLYA